MNGKGPVIISLREGVGEVGGFLGVLHGFQRERRGGGGSSNEKGTIENWQPVSGGSIESYGALLGDHLDFIVIQTKFSHPPPPRW